MKKLTPKQDAFIKEYILNGGNGLQAAKKAGYKGNDETLATVAKENIRKPHLKEALEEHQKLLTKAFVWTADDKRKLLQEIANRCLTVVPVKDKDGQVTGDFEFDAGNAIRAIAEDNKMAGHHKEKETVMPVINIHLSTLDQAL